MQKIKVSTHTCPTRVVIADENHIYLYALQNLIGVQKNINLIASCESLKELFLELNKSEVDVLLIDLLIFEKATIGIKKINQEYPNIKIIGISIDESKSVREEIIEAGAHEHIHKWRVARELMDVI